MKIQITQMVDKQRYKQRGLSGERKQALEGR